MASSLRCSIAVSPASLGLHARPLSQKINSKLCLSHFRSRRSDTLRIRAAESGGSICLQENMCFLSVLVENLHLHACARYADPTSDIHIYIVFWLKVPFFGEN